MKPFDSVPYKVVITKHQERIMGYTHYYDQTKDFSKKRWENLVDDTRTIIAYCKKKGIHIDFEWNEQKEPEISDEMIRFNGRGDEGYETFVLVKKKPKSWRENTNEYFYFCKTARKPYDLAVGLVLLRAESNAPKVLKISSDGYWEKSWKYIQEAYKEIFKDEPVCPFPQQTVLRS
jgi:hypothetical protein